MKMSHSFQTHSHPSPLERAEKERFFTAFLLGRLQTASEMKTSLFGKWGIRVFWHSVVGWLKGFSFSKAYIALNAVLNLLFDFILFIFAFKHWQTRTFQATECWLCTYVYNSTSVPVKENAAASSGHQQHPTRVQWTRLLQFSTPTCQAQAGRSVQVNLTEAGHMVKNTNPLPRWNRSLQPWRIPWLLHCHQNHLFTRS